MKVLDLFSGIGGFSLGLERAGFETVAFCEIDKFCQKVLNKHWPGVPIYDDVREITRERLVSDGITGIEVVTGGFPCQDLSVAGKQAGITAERSGLWSELCRIIGDIQPRYAIVENVTALISGDSGRWFGRVLGDLAEIGYDCEWHCIPASELGAHHHRDRVWIICSPNKNSKSNKSFNDEASIMQENNVSNDHGIRGRLQQELPEQQTEANTNNDGTEESLAYSNSPQCERHISAIGILTKHAKLNSSSWWEIEPELGRVANGIPDRAHRLKGLGNAVVPQIPELIGRAIMEIEECGTQSKR